MDGAASERSGGARVMNVFIDRLFQGARTACQCVYEIKPFAGGHARWILISSYAVIRRLNVRV